MHAQSSEPSPGGNRSRRIFSVGALLLAVAAVIWFGAATFVAYRLRYPPSLADGRTDVSGPHVPRDLASSRADPKSAFGAEFENITLTTEDGDTAGAWVVRGTQPNVAVVLLPPAGGTRRMMMPWIRFIHDAGFSVLVTDSGDGARQGVGWGWRERKFALTAGAALIERGFMRLAAVGISEGGAAAIFAQAERPAFRAIVADSAYANLATMFRRIPALAGLNPAFLNTVLRETGWFLGRPLDQISPADAARHLSGCALLAIQNRGDQLTTVEDAKAIHGAASAGQMILYDGNGHADAIFEQPDYASSISAFLDRGLGGTPVASTAGE